MDESPINNHNTNNKTSREPTDHHQNRGWGIKQMSVILWWTIAKRTRNISRRSSSSVLITSTSGSSKVEIAATAAACPMRNDDHHRICPRITHIWRCLTCVGTDGRARERCNRPPKNTNKSNLSAVDPRNDPHFVAGCVHCNPLGTDRSLKKREIGDNRLRVITVIH